MPNFFRRESFAGSLMAIGSFLGIAALFYFQRNHGGSSTASATPEIQYVLIGVSGGLQDGFPDHSNLDYHSGQPDESRAILLGRGLVRGYKAFLDVMQPDKSVDWRQYTPEPGQPLINCNVFASGCHEHANQYWLYIVDSRQVFSVLAKEPRFLSITPDTGLIELNAEETSPPVRDFLRHEIKIQGKPDMDQVAVPLVTAVWFHESHVPSPAYRIKDDGTEVTNFPNSLALWAGVDDSDRTAIFQSTDAASSSSLEAVRAQQKYWDGIRLAVRNAEQNRPSDEELSTYGPPFKCQKKARFGVGNNTARVNQIMSASKLLETLHTIGHDADFKIGELVHRDQEPRNCSQSVS